MEITSKLNKSQFNEVRMLYADFFRSINFDDCYNNKMLYYFAIKKAVNCFKHDKFSQYYFATQDNEIIGFIHGKIIDNIGLICHVYVKEKYRKRNVLTFLYKPLLFWFKENNILTMEIEVSKDNNIVKNLERNNWHLVRDFDDASVFQKKI